MKLPRVLETACSWSEKSININPSLESQLPECFPDGKQKETLKLERGCCITDGVQTALNKSLPNLQGSFSDWVWPGCLELSAASRGFSWSPETCLCPEKFGIQRSSPLPSLWQNKMQLSLAPSWQLSEDMRIRSAGQSPWGWKPYSKQGRCRLGGERMYYTGHGLSLRHRFLNSNSGFHL